MEIVTVLGGIAFAVFLAALAVSPNAIATYLQRRAEHDAASAAR